MTFSLNEIEAMSKRAARGAGLPWGLCEEAAKGTRWLASFGLPGPALLADLLELNDRLPPVDLSPISLSGDWRAPAGRLSPLIAGSAMSDSAMRMDQGDTITMVNVSFPLLVVPFASGAALRLQGAVTVEWGDVHLTTDGLNLSIQGPIEALETDLTDKLCCFASAGMTAPKAPVVRGTLDSDVAARLNAFAHRTYAPATEQSRLLGAGAGLSDND